MFGRPSYGFGKPVKTDVLEVLELRLGSDGILRQSKIIEWTFENGATRRCRVFESFRRCKTGGQEYPPFEGRWAWTGERYTEPIEDPPLARTRIESERSKPWDPDAGGV